MATPDKPKKRKYKLPRIACPLCTLTVSLTSAGQVPRHKDGTRWCAFQFLKPEQYNVLVKDGLLIPKWQRARQIARLALEAVGYTLADLETPK